MNPTTQPEAPGKPPAPAPIGGLYDPRFKYVRSHQTDLSATFARVRAEIAAGRRL